MATLTPAQVRLSRRLSKVLRHAPETVGLTLDEQGWTPVTTLLDAPHHVHLSVDVSTAERVGRRRSADVVVLRVAAGTMAAAGHVFHLSENGVWLTAHVPPAFLSRA